MKTGLSFQRCRVELRARSISVLQAPLIRCIDFFSFPFFFRVLCVCVLKSVRTNIEIKENRELC